MTLPANHEGIKNSTEALFDGVDYQLQGPGYQEGLQSRKIEGFAYGDGRVPLIHVKVEQVKLPESDESDVITKVKYYLSDGTRVDQAVEYTLPAGSPEAIVDQTLIFGDTWGRGIPYKPFSEKPEEPIDMMQLIVDFTQTERNRALEAGYTTIWQAH